MNKEKWFASAKEAGFESFEIYQQTSEERKFTWFDGELDTYVTSHILGTSFRGLYADRMVNASSEDTSDDQMEDVISSMKEQAEMITSEEKEMLRSPLPVTEINAGQFVHFGAKEIREFLKKTEETILSCDERVFQVSHLQFEEDTAKRTIVNSLGMDLSDTAGIHVLVAGVAVKDGEQVRTNFEFEKVDDLDTFDLNAFAQRLCDQALGQLNAETPASGNYPVIIEKGAFTQLFAAFSSMFSGEQIHKGISPLSDKLEKQIFSDLITVIDDPACADSAMPVAFDDEGCPVKRKAVVEKGIFKTALHSTRSALAMNTESTGNGFRSSYASTIGIMPKNFFITPGEKDLDELMAQMKDGIMITDFAGLHAGLNHVTGDFSLQCSGYRIKEGRKAGGLTLMTAAGNILDLLMGVRAVGSDLKWGVRSVLTPSILFESLAISGK